jgi:hypothetical protein
MTPASAKWIKVGRLRRDKEALEISAEFGGRKVTGAISLADGDDLYIYGEPR